MNLHSCTIVLSNHSTLICKTVDQSLNMIDYHGPSNIDTIFIEANDGNHVLRYQALSIEESIESLMDL